MRYASSRPRRVGGSDIHANSRHRHSFPCFISPVRLSAHIRACSLLACRRVGHAVEGRRGKAAGWRAGNRRRYSVAGGGGKLFHPTRGLCRSHWPRGHVMSPVSPANHALR